MTRRKTNKIILSVVAGVLCGGAALLGALLGDDDAPSGDPSPSESQPAWRAEVDDADRQVAYQEAIDTIDPTLGDHRDRPLYLSGENTCFDLAQGVESDVIRDRVAGRFEYDDVTPDDELVDALLTEAIPELCPSAVD